MADSKHLACNRACCAGTARPEILGVISSDGTLFITDRRHRQRHAVAVPREQLLRMLDTSDMDPDNDDVP